MANENAYWKGYSGRTYEYTVYGLDTSWNAVSGNYIFARRVEGGWRAVYIGQSGDLADRIPDHEVWDCARRNGATHIHAHSNSNGEAARKAEEADLIKKTQPPCNTQGKWVRRRKGDGWTRCVAPAIAQRRLEFGSIPRSILVSNHRIAIRRRRGDLAVSALRFSGRGPTY